jgi:putative IMPACT (imprinted ancient) family translation regulator
VRCDFAELALLKARLRELDAEVLQETFGAEGVELEIQLPATRAEEAQARVSDISRGRYSVRRLD